MLAISATSVINKEGEIDSRSLFDSMADFMRRTQKRIPRTLFHEGTQFRTGDIIWMARDENVLVSLTEFDDSEIAQREIKSRESDPDFWGDSIEYDPVGNPEFWNVDDGITIPVYNAAIPLAISTVRSDRACSLYANRFSLKRQEVNRMTLRDSDHEALVKLFDGDAEQADEWLKNNVSPVNREITESGQITRDVEGDDNPVPEDTDEELEEETVEETDEVSEEAATSAEEPVAAEALVLEFTDEMAQQVSETVVKSGVFTEFRDGITALVTEIKDSVSQLSTTVADLQAASVARAKDIQELKKSDAEKKRVWLEDAPRNQQRVSVTYRPSQSASTAEINKRSMEEMAQETLANIKQ
jgi:hypothetical protein